MSNINEAMIQHESLVFKVIKRYFPSRIDDDDIIQTGRIGLWKALKSLEKFNPNNIETYMRKCIKTEIIKELQKEYRKKRKLDESEYYVYIDKPQRIEISDNSNDFMQVYIEDYFSTLSEREKEIYKLSSSGYTALEISKVLGIARSTVTKHIIKMKKDIRELCY